MRLMLVPLALLAGVGLLAPAETIRAQTLRYGGEEGRQDRYRLATMVRIHQDFQGAAVDLTVRSTGVLALTLERSHEDTLTFAVAFDSLQLAFEGAPVASPDLSCVVGRIMRLRLSREGRVLDFEVPADLCETPPGFDLKHMVSHFFPRLPEKAARPGVVWSDTLTYPLAQQGIESQVSVVTSYTAKDKRKETEGELLEIGYATRTTLSGQGSREGTPLFLDGSGAGSGTILFDAGGHTFWSSSGTQALELRVDVRPEGQPPLSIPIRQEITAEIEHL
jgi:hypothetical protein